MEQVNIGIIGGSGLYQMPELQNLRELTIETPFGSPSDAFIIGELEGVTVAFLPRHGRGHKLTPSELPFRANVYAMKLLGVEYILSVSAVGSLQEQYAPTDFVIPDQFFDRTRARAHESTFFGEGIVGHITFADPVCNELGDIIEASCREVGVTTHRGDTVFVHVLEWPDRLLSIPDFGAQVTSARLLKNGQPVDVAQTSNGITLTVPPATNDDMDRVIVLVTRRVRD